ncbi:alpha-(1,3)-fucosyltransferase C-like [Homarus americanus]|uniref:alpha-(1,3)-fucosyltransferase C-like n=1 Tax=Homarus americanus TaxID=6706 RepID=UPI001C452BB5|nr:alpha-(1,3)-fucosyltransferase C-like [Homarus americanus]
MFMAFVVFFEGREDNLIDPVHRSAQVGGHFRSPKIWDRLVPEDLAIVEKGPPTASLGDDTSRTVTGTTGSGTSGRDTGGRGDLEPNHNASAPLLIHKMPPVFFHTDVGLNPRNPPLKTILVWAEGYGTKTMSFGYGRAPFVTAQCEVDTCMMTANRSFVPLQEFDALIFHFRAVERDKLPQRRSPHQRWVFWEVESASYIYQDPGYYNNMFNWTMTYRRNSDIPYPYGQVTPITSPSPTTINLNTNYAAGKTKMAAWFVSNCISHSRREKLVRFMQKFIKIDVYGKCGPLECSRDTTHQCYQMLERDYKFYLSFENSLCKDYVTEKLFSVLQYNVVPVVLGLGDYASITPPHSHINVLDFESLDSLTDYLKYLDSNDTAYNEYFRWKGHYVVENGWSNKARRFCDLCKKLHQDNTAKTYTNMRKWFMVAGGCKKLNTRAWQKMLVG